MLQPLDGPAAQTTLSANTTVVQEIKVGGSPLSARKVITVQPTSGRVYVYFGDDTASAPSAGTVSSNGIVVFKNAKETFEAGEKQPVYVLAVSGTVSVKIVERA